MKIHSFEPKWLLVFSFFIAGIFLGGLAIYLYVNAVPPSGYKIHSTNASYKFINPLLAVDLYEERQFSVNKSLELKAQGLIDNGIRDGKILSASMYFRDIEPGFWSSIAEDDRFSPGKLLKIPIMIVYYKLAETDPQILDNVLVFNGPVTIAAEVFPPPAPLVVGESYSVDALIRHMIVNSDDDATNLLFENIDKSALQEIFSDLGIQFKEEPKTKDYISLKLYSLFFRVLYNATYLNREYSERALGLLVDAESGSGISAGVPKDISTANRFGANILSVNGARVYEMYDCGINYYPQHPYLLCGIGRGKNLQEVEAFLRSLGTQIYGEMDYRYRNK